MKYKFLLILLLISFQTVTLPHFIASSSGLETLNDTSYISLGGYFEIVGEVKNKANYPLEFVKISATYYDISNNVIGSNLAYTIMDILLPNQKSPFSISSYPQSNLTVHHYTLTVSGSKSSVYPYNKLLVQGATPIKLYDQMILYGEVLNYGEMMATYVKAVATFYNSEGLVIGTGFSFTDPKEINPGESAPFNICTCPRHYIPYNYTLQVQCSEKISSGSISCIISSNQTILGNTQTVTGSINPSTVNADVLLTYTKPNGNKITETIKSDTYGYFQDTFIPDLVGLWKVKASWNGTHSVLGSESQEISFKVISIGDLKIIVQDENGNPIPDASIISSSQPSNQTALSGYSGPDGTYSFTDILTGTYQIRVTKSEYSTNDMQVTIYNEQTTSQPIQISRISTKIKIMVKDASLNFVSGVTITSTSQPTGQSSLNGVTANDGTYTFNDVKVGSYTFSLSKNNFKSKTDSLTTTLGATIEKTINLEVEPQGIPSYQTESIIIGLALILVKTRKNHFKFSSMGDSI